MTKTLVISTIMSFYTLCIGAHDCPLPFVQNLKSKAVGDHSQANETMLFVTLTNGNIYSFMLSEKPEITFEEHDFVVSTTSTTFRYKRSEIDYFHFADSSVDVEDIKNNEMRIIRQDDKILIYGLQSEFKPIRVYNVNGILCDTIIDITDDFVNINLSSLAPSTYIIKLGNNQSLKILKK